MDDKIKAKLKSGEYILTKKKYMLNVKYGNRFVKYKMQVGSMRNFRARAGSSRIALGPVRVKF
jgi:hypothetical protein